MVVNKTYISESHTYQKPQHYYQVYQKPQYYYQVYYHNKRLPLENPSELERILRELFDLSKKEAKTAADVLRLIAQYKENPYKYARHRNLCGKPIYVIEVNGDKRIFYTVDPKERIIYIIDIDGHRLYERLCKKG